MKVKVKEGQQVENPNGGVYSAGDSFDVPDGEAKQLIARGWVEKVTETKKRPAPSSDGSSKKRSTK